MQEWEFRQDSRRRWYWRRTTEEGTHNVSSQAFESRAACVADAVKAGFSGEDPDAEKKPGS